MPVLSIFSALHLTSSAWQGNKLSMLIWSIAIGMILASAITVINRKSVGKLVRQLLRQNATTEKQAKTLKELGFIRQGFFRYALRDGSILRKTVYRMTDNDRETRYYIPEDKVGRAETLYGGKGASLFSLIITVILFGVIAIAAISVVPYFIDLVTALGK